MQSWNNLSRKKGNESPCVFQFWKHLKHNITMLRVPKTIPVRLDKSNQKRHECDDETQLWDSQLLPCFMASLLCLKTSRKGRGGNPRIYQTGLNCQGNTGILSGISFLKAVVGLVLWQNWMSKHIKHILLLSGTWGCCPLCGKIRDIHICWINEWIRSFQSSMCGD